MTTSHRSTWEHYAASWKATSPAERQALFARSLAADYEYRDPLSTTQGWGQLDAYINQFQQQVPGGHFVTKRFSAHHDRSLVHWDMCDVDGNVVGEGLSYGQYDLHGKLVAMTGFFETPGAESSGRT